MKAVRAAVVDASKTSQASLNEMQSVAIALRSSIRQAVELQVSSFSLPRAGGGDSAFQP